MMRVIVTGANGFVGSSLIKKLIENNCEVLALDISFSNNIFCNNPLITTLETDLSDISTLKNIIESGKYDVFYNFAWQGVNGPQKSMPDVQLNNILISIKCAELAHFLKCKKYLCAGTIAERAVESLPFLKKTNPSLAYASAKHCCHIMLENYCKNIGMPFIWMQFANIYGPNNKTGNLISYTIQQLKKGLKADFGPANQPYDFVYINDLIEAVFRLGFYNTKKNFYYIGSNEPRLLKDYLLKIGQEFGRPELINIGTREDDGVKYDFSMMDSSITINEIGNYISDSFEELIKKTIINY